MKTLFLGQDCCIISNNSYKDISHTKISYLMSMNKVGTFMAGYTMIYNYITGC